MEREFNPKLTWNSSRDDIINEFYKPALSNCVLYQRLSGYFSSSTFANVANEILDFIRSKSKYQLITSPNLSDEWHRTRNFVTIDNYSDDKTLLDLAAKKKPKPSTGKMAEILEKLDSIEKRLTKLEKN